ncbi:DUF5107 domain-containing protein [Psychromicrobium sp. YIM B11713]|uniref:DUF5107 domain-containing protein n=1 Tax=Psychromicrobium sp. YIM B11713 TaxID=3145233 RepID=UPI00374EFC71
MNIERLRLTMASLGPLNPLPNVGKPLEDPYQISGDVPPEIIENSRYGHPATLHPYQLQDQYSRQLNDSEQTVVTLENDHLRARFLPELGGRLWELIDKKSGKNLLHTPEQIQLGNLALRNAWFAGGIEWNIGTRGHSPTTCSPLHTALLTTPEGQEVLRMWEFDRLREVIFQIDAWLPADSRFLQLAVRVTNPNPQAVPIYWWSNAAVPQSSQTRVIAPASTAFASDYQHGIKRKTPQNLEGVDCTWPARNSSAADYFFDLAPGQRRWIVASDAQGDGLAMLSSSRLRGRKLFVWGESQGGHRWQEWLTPRGGHYAEIQAGLAQTQFENLALPAGESWSWLECYGNAELQPEQAQGEWDAAVRHAEQRLSKVLPEEELEASYLRWRSWAELPPQRQLLNGSGWGALEAERRRRAGEPWRLPGVPFAKQTLGAEQASWLRLLEERTFSGANSYVSGASWAQLLAEAEGDAAAIALHRGVLAQGKGEHAAAAEQYRRSIELQPSALAWRGLAIAENNPRHYLAACALEPEQQPLLTEALTALLTAGESQLAGQLLEASGLLATAIAGRGRMAFLAAQIFAETARSQQAIAILKSGLSVADIREGENSIAELWQRVLPGEPVPGHYQFTMS